MSHDFELDGRNGFKEFKKIDHKGVSVVVNQLWGEP